MGKTPKKAAPGGDERNLYNWRPKAKTAPSNSSETSLPKRQRESEILNRPKLSTFQKRVPPVQRKSFKSLSTKIEVNQPAKQKGKLPSTSKEKKITAPEKSEESKIEKTMQPESEEAEPKLNPVIEKEDQKKDNSADNEVSTEECVDRAPSKEPEPATKEQEDTINKETSVEKEQTESVKANTSDKAKEDEDLEDSDIKLSLEVEDNSVQMQEDKSDNKDIKDDSKEECSSSSKNDLTKEDAQSESQTDTESYSVDVLESTTSEVSEMSEIPPQEKEKETEKEPEPEKVDKDTTKDASFVSYDPSIMLKDVQIKLNDCLKENSKLFDASNVEHSSSIQPPKESFGKTLRSLSGRRSLNRMRFVTLREHRYSPNDSLFVNTSTESVPPNDSLDFKILRYSTGLSDMLPSSNGSPTERKRKNDTDDWNSTKKQRTETEQGLLHSSIDLLKGLRRPIQVSTPVSELKFQTGKLNLGNEQESKSNESPKKWCSIM
nr:PREDICTED: nucleolin-like [Megachile rotundata]